MITPKEFLGGDDENEPWTGTVEEALLEFARMSVIEELKKHIEHPTKPGYKRSDIVKRIKQLENE